MRVKVKRTEQNRITWDVQDYRSGEEADIPDEYAEEYVHQGYVEELKAQKKFAKKASSEELPRLDGQKLCAARRSGVLPNGS
jgi:hypothetical protein